VVEGARVLLVRHGRHDWLAPLNRFAGRLCAEIARGRPLLVMLNSATPGTR